MGGAVLERVGDPRSAEGRAAEQATTESLIGEGMAVRVDDATHLARCSSCGRGGGLRPHDAWGGASGEGFSDEPAGLGGRG